MASFDEHFNYDDIFLRDISLGLKNELHRLVRWVNVFEDNKYLITVPFFYSLVGDNRFLKDAFIDDTASKIELNYDQIPRGHMMLQSWRTKLEEMTNNHVPFFTYEEKDGMLRKVYGKYTPIPMVLNYDVEILLDSEGDIWKCSQALLDSFHKYKFFHIEYKSIRVDCSMYYPSDTQPTIERELSLTNSEHKKISFGIELHTNYPKPPIDSTPITANKRVVFKGNIREMKEKTNPIYVGNHKKKK